MHKSVYIIGAGQLGSRHLQSLKQVSSQLKITVIDPSEKSLATAKERYEGISGNDHQIEYFSSLPDIKNNEIDIAIIPSNSNVRRTVIENLLSKANVKYMVLEKLLFTKKQDYEVISELLKKKGTKTYVNCTMRMVPFYIKCKEHFQNQVVNFQVTGSQYGLITNAIHYLDYASYLNNTHSFEMHTNILDSAVIESKRPGFKELNGTLIAHYSNGAKTILSCLPDGTLPLMIEMTSPTTRIIVREWEQKAWVAEAKNSWAWKEIEAPIPFQSQLTAIFVNELLETGSCKLVPYEESKIIHLALLESLSSFLNKQNQTLNEYPFT